MKWKRKGVNALAIAVFAGIGLGAIGMTKALACPHAESAATCDDVQCGGGGSGGSGGGSDYQNCDWDGTVCTCPDGG